ncbi:MAG: hypothetical protein K9H61_12015, partial [Bacteroidia bacterium]|nr:hypothetical protein [Bacteroidia bacterium]
VKGARHYELSNHLGNVLSVVSDRKIEVDESYTFQAGGGYIYQNGAYATDPLGNYFQNNPADGIIDGYVAEVISATDYYTFGSPMPGRSWQVSEYSFGFNGQEKDDEVSGAGNTMTAEFWEYDTRLGRRWNLDPKPNSSLSSYSCFLNNPICVIDANGDTTTIFNRFGKFLGSINDKLENQTHFMYSADDYNNVISGNSGKSTEEIGSAIREKSIAYYDSNTEKKMKEAFKRYPNGEFAFILGFKNSVSKKLSFEILYSCKPISKEQAEAYRKSNTDFNGEYGVIWSGFEKEMNAKFYAPFLTGHSHPLFSTHSNPENPSQAKFYEFPNLNMNPRFINSDELVDYKMYLNSPHPLMILSRKGISIYQGLMQGDEVPPDEYFMGPNFNHGVRYNWGNHKVLSND